MPTDQRRADCLFCRIVAGELPADVVAETERTIAFRDINPQAAVHTLVVTRDHHPNVAALGAADPALLAELISAGAAVADRQGVAGSGYRLLLNTGADAGQTVFHVHVHVLGGEPLGGMVGGPIKTG
jgi:histidine triad (HIT) family protein